MKVANYFWGFLLLSLGILWFNTHLDFIPFEYDTFYKLWPLGLIFIGIMFFNVPKVLKGILAGFCGILLAFILFANINNGKDEIRKIKIDINKELKMDEDEFFDF